MAPAEVPEMASMVSQDSSSSRSSTPQVKAPCAPPPCRARSTSCLGRCIGGTSGQALKGCHPRPELYLKGLQSSENPIPGRQELHAADVLIHGSLPWRARAEWLLVHFAAAAPRVRVH